MEDEIFHVRSSLALKANPCPGITPKSAATHAPGMKDT